MIFFINTLLAFKVYMETSIILSINTLPAFKVYTKTSIILSINTLPVFKVYMETLLHVYFKRRGARWPSGRASDSGARGRGFETFRRRVVSLSKDTLTPRKVLVIPRKRWLFPDMTEKLFTGTLSLKNNNKKKQKNFKRMEGIYCNMIESNGMEG